MLIYGKDVREELKQRVMGTAAQIPMNMAIIQVGDDMSSASYVRSIQRFAAEAGINADIIALAGDASEQQVMTLIEGLNKDDSITGIMVQTPLPAGFSISRVINTIDPGKDVEGIHNANLGKLISGEQGVRPCTPAAVIRILKAYDIPMEGKKVAIVGRSTVVGSPLAIMMTAENATVTLCHSRTRELAGETSQADIVVAAVGKAGFITPDMISKDAVVIDVGTNYNESGKLVGDVHEEIQSKARMVSAVPGGVGLITVAELFMNLTYLGTQK